jgi:hypothetical protein
MIQRFNGCHKKPLSHIWKLVSYVCHYLPHLAQWLISSSRSTFPLLQSAGKYMTCSRKSWQKPHYVSLDLTGEMPIP